MKGDNQVYEGASIIGAAYTLPEIRDIPVVEGRFFTETEDRMRKHVAVIGQDIRDAVLGGVSPIGKTIRVAGEEFTVIGLLEKQGSSFGRSLDNPVYIPMSVYEQMYGSRRGSAVFGRARPGTNLTMDEALDMTRSALRARYHTPPGQPDNFDTLTPDSVRSFVDQILGVIAAIVVPVTSISLVVGGIVIMNIMLVSVTERTREIGIRKSLGARQNDIMLQFLTESVILSLAGGLIGLAGAASVAILLSALFGATLKVTLPYVVLSIFVSSTVGIISGWYPAQEGGADGSRSRAASRMTSAVRIGLGETIGMALGAVWSHKFRSGLTILGIVIGITTVVTVGSLLTGIAQGHRRFLSGVWTRQHFHRARERRPERRERAAEGTEAQADDGRSMRDYLKIGGALDQRRQHRAVHQSAGGLVSVGEGAGLRIGQYVAGRRVGKWIRSVAARDEKRAHVHARKRRRGHRRWR